MRGSTTKGERIWPAVVAAAAVLLLTAPHAFASRTAPARPDLLTAPAFQPIAATQTLAPVCASRGFALHLDVDPHPATFALFNDLTPAPEHVEPEKLASGVESWDLTPNLQRIQLFVTDSRWCREFLGPIDSPNLYQAFGLDPMNMTDPLGLCVDPDGKPCADYVAYYSEGWLYQGYSALAGRAQDTSRSAVDRTGALLAQTALLLPALAEEYLVRPLANTPHRVAAIIDEGNAKVNEGVVSGDAVAVSEGVGAYCAAFCEAGVALLPFSKEVQAASSGLGTTLRSGWQRIRGVFGRQRAVSPSAQVPKPAHVVESPPAGPSQQATASVPHGFRGAADFQAFGQRLQAGLKAAGYGDVQPIMQGSSVTGQSFRTGQPFDAGRVSDFDVALASRSLLTRAKSIGIGLRSGGARTGPLTAADLEKLGLAQLAQDLTTVAGRPVNFMIYETPGAALGRAPGIPVPQ